MTCREGHEHLTEEGQLKCDNGRMGWFTCRGAEDIVGRGGTPVEGHFYHLSDEEAGTCNYTDVLRNLSPETQIRREVEAKCHIFEGSPVRCRKCGRGLEVLTGSDPSACGCTE